MRKLFNNIKNTAVNTFGKVAEKAKEVVEDVKGLTQSTETILLVVFVVVLIGAFFAPAITEWFADVITNLGTKTDDLFKFAPTTQT
ncbi:MAG: hypothetical protein R3Y35_15020 [Clostridia bacterium]